ncbi:MAG: family 16 glycosylhydrolase [Capsulimonadaceae bacterium]
MTTLRSALARIRTLAPLVVLTALVSTPRAGLAAPPAGYHLVWSEEFHEGIGHQPSRQDWNWDTGDHNANDELEDYVDDAVHSQIVADPDATDGQALQILSTNDGNGVYKSARMTTAGKHEFRYGFVEARIRIPYGQGIWPAFWMLGTDIGQVGWPRCGEVDIMENIGKAAWWGQNASSLHGPGRDGGQASQFGNFHLPAGQTFHDRYHLFQMLWKRDAISFFIDGKLFETRTPADFGADPWVYNHPMFFLLNTAVGGDWPGNPDSSTVWPQRMLVDYIRVYQGKSVRQPAPASVAAHPGDGGGQIRLTWKDNPAVTGYYLYRGTGPGREVLTSFRTVAGNVFIDNGLRTRIPYYYRVVAVNDAGESAMSREVHSLPSPAVDLPFHNRAAAIPGVIRLCNFDEGGEGVGYHSTADTNQGGQYRLTENMGIENCNDAGGGFDVGWSAPGQWLNYTVDVARTAGYTIALRVSSGADGGRLHIEDESGHNIPGPIVVPGTGDWQKWTTVTATMRLTRGRHVLKVYEDTGGYNMSTMTFRATGG